MKIKSVGKSLGQAMPEITKDKSTEPDEYETKDHMNTLVKAHEIMNNPVHMAAVKKLAGRHAKAIQGIKSIQDVKDHYQSKYGPSGKKLASLKDSEAGDDEGSESY